VKKKICNPYTAGENIKGADTAFVVLGPVEFKSDIIFETGP
jgi:hypothetical protein